MTEYACVQSVFPQIKAGMIVIVQNKEYEVIEKGKTYIDTKMEDGNILTIPRLMIDTGKVKIKTE